MQLLNYDNQGFSFTLQKSPSNSTLESRKIKIIINFNLTLKKTFKKTNSTLITNLAAPRFVSPEKYKFFKQMTDKVCQIIIHIYSTNLMFYKVSAAIPQDTKTSFPSAAIEESENVREQFTHLGLGHPTQT